MYGWCLYSVYIADSIVYKLVADTVTHRMSLISLPRETLFVKIVSRLPLKDQWRLRRSSKQIAVFIDDWHFEKSYIEISMRVMVETGLLLGLQVRNTLVLGKLTDEVTVRVMYKQMAPLRRWFKQNRVGVDAGGYYTRISDTERVRIGLWETGVDFVPRKRKIFTKLTVLHICTSRSPVVRDGYVIYNPNDA